MGRMVYWVGLLVDGLDLFCLSLRLLLLLLFCTEAEGGVGVGVV